MAHPRIQFALLSTTLSALAWLALTLSLPAQGLPPNWPAGYPAWWYDANDPQNGLIDATRPELNQQNHAVLNQGQLWNLAAQGIEELNTQLMPIGGAGFGLTDLQEPGASPAYYAPANIGQLKHVASKFYNRFTEIGYQPGSVGWNPSIVLNEGAGDHSPLYPWKEDQTPENMSIALIGQAKHTFSWDISLYIQEDINPVDGIPDWQITYAHSLDPDGDYDSDNVSNSIELQHGTNPLDSRSTPILINDTDQDSIEDDWELQYFGHLSRTGLGDYDSDQIPDYVEYALSLSPLVKDSLQNYIEAVRELDPRMFIRVDAPIRLESIMIP